jgi:zinc protease
MRWTDSVVRDVLPNGLTLLVQRDSSVPVVSAVTHVKAGYFDEPDRWVGISHVLEHMYFKGSDGLGPGDLARATQRLGGYLNAATSYERTIYYTVVPSANGGLERAMRLQATALRGVTLAPAALASELEVIIQEAKRKLDSPPAVTVETLYELLFRVHRMRRWRIGTEAGLRALRSEDLRAYYSTRYTPDRVIVALTGDLDVDAALRAGHAYYGDWRHPAAVMEASPAEPPARWATLRVLRGDVERPTVAVGWRTVGPTHPDAPALDVAAGVLGMGRASWLSTQLRLPGLAAHVSTSHYTPGEVGVFSIGLTSEGARVATAVRRAVAAAAALADPGPDDDQLARVRALTATGWARRLESVDGRATLLAEFEALGDYAMAEQYREATERVTAADVRRVAAAWLTRDAACAVAYLPSADGEVLRDLAWPPAEKQAPPSPPTSQVPEPRHQPPSLAADTQVGDVLVRQYPGADVLVRTRRGTGLAALSVQFPGLTSGEPEGLAGLSRLLLHAALRGAAKLSAQELAALAEGLGGSIGAPVRADRVGLALTTRATAAREGMALLRTILDSPTLTADEVRREAELQADDAARRRDDMFGYPLDRVLGVAFARHPYARPLLGDPSTIGAVDPERVRTWHAEVLRRRPVVVVVGDLDPEDLLEAGAVFADWSDAPHISQPTPPPWTSGAHAESREKAQSALALAFAAGRALPDDRATLHVLGALLSGLAGRLFEELREQRALAYTVHAAPWIRMGAAAFLAYVGTSPEREDEARTAMLEVLDRVADAPLQEEELDRARAYAAGLVAIRRQHAGSVATELTDAWMRGTLPTFADEESARRSVTAAAVRRVAGMLFDAGRRAECVVRGRGRDGRDGQ